MEIPHVQEHISKGLFPLFFIGLGTNSSFYFIICESLTKIRGTRSVSTKVLKEIFDL